MRRPREGRDGMAVVHARRKRERTIRPRKDCTPLFIAHDSFRALNYEQSQGFLPACWLSRGRKAQVVDGLELARTVPTRLDHARAARSGVGTRGAGFVRPHSADDEGCGGQALRCDDRHRILVGVRLRPRLRLTVGLG
eukprot:scaffold46183_cov71-Phaeocystis_antarctica.AAC.3